MSSQDVEREKTLIQLVVLSTGVWALFFTLLFALKTALPYKGLRWELGCIVVSSAISSLALFIGREPLFRQLLRIARKKTLSEEERAMLGTWRLKIEYLSADACVQRIGDIQIGHSATGLVMQGAEIRDSFTSAKVIENWISEFSQVFTYGQNRVLFYAYEINRGKSTCDKVGYVVALNQADRDHFAGQFTDVEVGTGKPEQLRSGTVVLERVSVA
jgi:hypothetical protein